MLLSFVLYSAVRTYAPSIICRGNTGIIIMLVSPSVSILSALPVLHLLKDFLQTWLKYSSQQEWCAEFMLLLCLEVKVIFESQMSDNCLRSRSCLKVKCQIIVWPKSQMSDNCLRSRSHLVKCHAISCLFKDFSFKTLIEC
jgi:hypothetical protein